MLHVVLVEPEIPPNTGNIARLCLAAGARLHLVEPLGFTMDDRQLRRAGLDYHEYAHVEVHKDWERCKKALGERRVFALTTRAKRNYAAVDFRVGDAFVFGAETAGLDAELLEEFPADLRLRLPMLAGNRSVNLSNAVAVVVFEAWRQIGFLGAT